MLTIYERDGFPTADLPDGSFAQIVPLTFGRARINVSAPRCEWTVRACW